MSHNLYIGRTLFSWALMRESSEVVDSTLEKRIRILVSNSTIEKGGASYRYTDPSVIFTGGAPKVESVTDKPSDWELTNKQVILLVKLYQQLTSAEQAAMLGIMQTYFEDSYRHELVTVAVLTFVHTDNADKLVDTLIQKFTKYDQIGYLRSVAALNKAVKYKPNLFPESVIEKLYDWVNDYYDGRNQLGTDKREYPTLYREVTSQFSDLHDKCNIILSRNFAIQIESAFNPELNQDEQKVIETIEQIGFPLDLIESLRHINELVQNANKPMKYRDCMSAIRVFTERLYEKIAKELNSSTRVDGKDSEEAAKLFKKHGLISTDMSSLMVSLRHFLSNDGTHRLKSRKEDARIAKNMTIELSLYLLTRIRELDKSTKEEVIAQPI